MTPPTSHIPGHETAADRLRGVVAILIAATIWGSLPLVLHQVDGSSLIKVFFRVAIAFVAMTGFLMATGRLQRAFTLDRKLITNMIIQGVILGINWSLFLGAFELASVATVELLMYMGPVIVAIIAPFTLKDPFDRRILLPLALSFGGLLTILVPQGVSFSGSELIGAAMAFSSSFTYAILMVRNKRFVTNVSGAVVVWFGYVGSLLFLTPLAVWQFAVGNGPTGGIADYGWFAILGVGQTAVASLFFFYGLKRLRAEESSVLTYMEPVTAVIFAAMVLGEPIVLTTAIGGILVVAGGTMVARMQAQRGLELVPVEAGAVEDDG